MKPLWRTCLVSACLALISSAPGAETDRVIPFDTEGPVMEIPISDGPVREMEVIRVRSSDADMNRAFAEARASLANALAGTEKTRGRFSPSLALQVAMQVPDADRQVEFVWVDTIRRSGKGFRGKLASWPRHMPGKRLRDEVAFLHPQIADWAVQAVDGRFYGYFTTRVLIHDLEEPLASEIRALLVPRPVPQLWR